MRLRNQLAQGSLVKTRSLQVPDLPAFPESLSQPSPVLLEFSVDLVAGWAE